MLSGTVFFPCEISNDYMSHVPLLSCLLSTVRSLEKHLVALLLVLHIHTFPSSVAVQRAYARLFISL